jgi:hypothetical protein
MTPLNRGPDSRGSGPLSFIRRFFCAISSLAAPRSSEWRKLRNEHLLKNPCCAVCGSKKNVVPHHVVPFSTDPSLELDPDNLVTLCEGEVFNCHLFFGHLKNWKRYNPEVVEDAAYWRKKFMEDRDK